MQIMQRQCLPWPCQLPRGQPSCRTRRALALDQPARPAAAAGSSRPAAERGISRGLQDIPPLVASVLSTPGLEAPEGSDMFQLLKVSEAYWKALRNSKDEPGKPGPAVVKRLSGALGQEVQFDVCICGGTLGVIIGLALQKLGHRVCIVEKRKLEGRNQEWNICRGSLQRLVSAGLLSQAELEACVVSEYNPVRVGLRGMARDVQVRDVMNLGVHPRLLLAALRRKFLEQGGTLLEHTAFKSAEVFDDGVLLRTLSARNVDLPMTPGDTNRPLACSAAAAAAAAGGSGGGSSGSGGGGGSGDGSSSGGSSDGSSGGGSSAHKVAAADADASQAAGCQHPSLTCRLVLDCMGHYGPIVKQMRGGAKPKGMVVVVGGCHAGVPPERNTSADLLYSLRDSEDDLQLFWEAFPAAGSDRTTYMFGYMDAHPGRPTFAALLEKYFQQLPEYQGVPLEQLRFKRILFGAFPCYPGASPLPPAFDRVLQIGDAAAGQSPLSFGGFGSMVRHLPRLTEGIDDALRADLLTRADLAWLQPYQPSLSAAWLFQRAMSVGLGELRRGHGEASAAQQAQRGEQGHLGAPGPPPPPVAPGSNASNAIVAAWGLHYSGSNDERPPQRQHSSPAMAAAGPAPSAAANAGTAAGGPASAQAAAAALAPASAGASAAAQRLPCSASAAVAQPSHPATGQRQRQQEAQQQPEPEEAGGCQAAAKSRSSSGAGMEGSACGWLDPGHVNRLMRCNFEVMRFLGDGVLRLFLSDTLRFIPLAMTMAGMSFKDPLAVVTVVRHLGVKALFDWTYHFLMLGTYTALHAVLSPLRRWLRGGVGAMARAPPLQGVAKTAGQPAAHRGQQGQGKAQESASAGGPGRVHGQEGPQVFSRRAGTGMGRLRFVLLRMLDALACGSSSD